jgi:hypothetical protein
LIRLLLKRNYTREKIEKLLIFIDRVLNLPLGIEKEFKKDIIKLSGKGDETMGLTWDKTPLAQVFKEEGREEELQNTLLVLINKKFAVDKIPETIEQAIANANMKKLKNTRDNIFEIKSMEELKQYLS